ncbi:hypothetical protein Asppvi_006467 [Aspergillus pseudoviridinutans]|uniref:Uncharacterized protein n=1 Tax=Aspergillus pseudoviridinutans TaxID=1517512 RepID=A0A9P3BCS7_9EURO|nr:uncharacterized protein Asppvi_006467 [Aspergillus pseudoviridinutans]GIJ87559.1 hypothetical protein Asppvi_006467 [Aspergillus pseudoviridinutans]
MERPNNLLTELRKRREHAQTQKTRAELKAKAAADATAAPQHSKQYLDWIAKYHKEQSKGFAILQRINALQALSRKTSTPEIKSANPPPYSSTTLDEMISALTLLYREHLETLQGTLAAHPTGGRAGDYHEFEFLRTTHNEKGQTLAWEEHQYTCAMRGGCCGRLCGCCSLPLRELFIPLSNGKRKKGGVYGHCTAECLCCNLFYGCYKPDSRLPKIDPALVKALGG